jgi:hypothetical protein
VHPTAVADAGGLLVIAGLLVGIDHEVEEVLALDATSLLLADYLSIRYEADRPRVEVDYGMVELVVREWFPARALAIDAALAAIASDVEVESAASLALAESLGKPLVTKNRALTSNSVAVLYC